jgi:hypothetical protein
VTRVSSRKENGRANLDATLPDALVLTKQNSTNAKADVANGFPAKALFQFS